MNKLIKLCYIFIPTIFLLFGLMILTPAKFVYAQEPQTVCVTGTNVTQNPSAYLGRTGGGGPEPDNPEYITGEPDGNIGYLYDAGGPGSPFTCYYYDLPYVFTTITDTDLITITAINHDHSSYRNQTFIYPEQGQIEDAACDNPYACNDQWRLIDNDNIQGSFTGTVGTLALCVYSDEVFGTTEYASADTISVTMTYGQYCYTTTLVSSCDTVQDYSFDESPAGVWTLDGAAAIVSSTLILNNNDMAAQNITDTVTGGIPYNAAISVTEVTAPTDLMFWLHDVTQTVTITQPGLYTASLTMTDSPTVATYLLWNLSDTTIDIGWTCIYTGTRSSSTCLAPLNGTFENDNNWQWIREADWKSDQQNAYLPYDSMGIIRYTQPLSLPTINDGEKLIMSFKARSACSNGDGLIGSRVQITETDPITVDYLFDTYLTPRLYEEDLSWFAGKDNIILQFANPGLGGCMGYTSTDSIYLDDICIFIESREPNLPITTTMTGEGFVDSVCILGGLGNFTSCDDVDEIMASLGIDMAYYRAVYAAGASVWDPEGWVPWLISAIFINLAALICFLMFMLIELIHFFTWLLNSILNYLLWLKIFLLGALAVLLGRVNWLAAAISNLTSWLVSVFINYIPWLLEILLNLNGLRLVANWLIGGWNNYLSTLGLVIGWLINALFIQPWNNLMPLFQQIYSYISTIPLLKSILDMLLSFLSSTWGLISTLFWFIWHNIIGLILLPVDFFNALIAGINDSAFDTPFVCSDENFWCLFLAGVQLINQTASQSIIYPLFIIGIILTTLVVLWINIKALFSINIK